MIDIQSVIEGCKQRIWHRQVPPGQFVGAAATMLSPGERRMLYWLGKNTPLEDGDVIIDAGCFLGGSTLGFATGLADRGSNVDPGCLHSYDMFIAPNDGYSLSMMPGKTPGASVRDIFDRAVSDYRDAITVHEGDILKASIPKSPFAILFVDVAKTRDINARILREFFPKMVPGKTILIQQDFNDHSCPWVNSSMEKLADYFDHLCDESGSRVYLYRETVPQSALEAAASMGFDEEFALITKAADREQSEVCAYFLRVAAGWPLFERDGASTAIAYLRGIKQRQPWEGQSYIDGVVGAMEQLKNAEGLEGYHRRYFAGAERR